MTCSSCKYKYIKHYGPDEDKSVIGDKGDFFYATKSFRRTEYQPYEREEKAQVFGCPNCGRVFIYTESMQSLDAPVFVEHEKQNL